MKRVKHCLAPVVLLSLAIAEGAAAPVPDRLAELERLALSGRDTAVLSLLEETAGDPGLDAEAREGALLEFAHRLQAMPAGSVGTEVIDYLKRYPSQVMVAHPDHAGAWVPRFNIRAAATGIEHAWRRSEAAYEGGMLLARDPGSFVSVFRDTTDLPYRQGLLDALRTGRDADLEAVAEAALEATHETPELAQVAGTAAVLTRDPTVLAKLLNQGPGRGLHRLLAELSQGLPQEDLGFLFEVAVDESNPAAAALAIAQLAPTLLDQGAVEDRLFALLPSPELGSAAALALSANPDPRRAGRLAALAASDEPGAARARLSLNLMAAERAWERPK